MDFVPFRVEAVISLGSFAFRAVITDGYAPYSIAGKRYVAVEKCAGTMREIKRWAFGLVARFVNDFGDAFRSIPFAGRNLIRMRAHRKKMRKGAALQF